MQAEPSLEKEERRPRGPPLVCRFGTCWRSFPEPQEDFASSVSLNRAQKAET
jgi:hypothetical protein